MQNKEQMKWNFSNRGNGLPSRSRKLSNKNAHAYYLNVMCSDTMDYQPSPLERFVTVTFKVISYFTLLLVAFFFLLTVFAFTWGRRGGLEFIVEWLVSIFVTPYTFLLFLAFLGVAIYYAIYGLPDKVPRPVIWVLTILFLPIAIFIYCGHLDEKRQKELDEIGPNT